MEACQPIDDWPANATMSCDEVEGDRFPDDVVPNHLGLFVVSERLKQMLLEVDPTGAYA